MSMNLLLGEHVTAFLLSFYKPVLMLAVFIPWAWLISSKLDKDARFFYLNHRMWNGIHLACGVAAIAVMLIGAIGWWFWLGWPLGAMVLLTPVLVYWKVRNNSVPENAKFALTGQSIAERMQARRLQRAARAATITFIDSDGNARDVPGKDDPLSEIHILSEDLFAPALAARASRLEMSVGRDGVQIMQTIDGLTYRRKPNPPPPAVRPR